jgi:hypothetical protein
MKTMHSHAGVLASLREVIIIRVASQEKFSKIMHPLAEVSAVEGGLTERVPIPIRPTLMQEQRLNRSKHDETTDNVDQLLVLHIDVNVRTGPRRVHPKNATCLQDFITKTINVIRDFRYTDRTIRDVLDASMTYTAGATKRVVVMCCPTFRLDNEVTSAFTLDFDANVSLR